MTVLNYSSHAGLDKELMLFHYMYFIKAYLNIAMANDIGCFLSM